MKRVLSLVLALVLVLGMMPTAFAAEKSGAEMLLDNDFISGKDGATVDAKLDVNSMLTRDQLAALIAELNGAKDEAAAFAQPTDYTDADTFQDWAKGYIAYAQENSWMGGYPDGSFGPKKGVKAQDLAAALMNALGYTVDTVEKYNTVLADAADLGIVVEGTELTRGEAFEAMWVAVSEVPMNTEEGLTLGVFLGKLEPATPENVALAVESVTSTDLKTVKVVFNEEVDSTTVNATNIAVTNGTPTLLADGKTVVVVLNPAVAQSSALAVVISNVKSVDGDTVATGTFNVTVTDTTLPTVVSATVVNAKKIDVFFSEPINFTSAAFAVLNDVKIDNVAVIAKATPDYANNKVTFEFPTALAAGSHTISIANMVDFATYKALTQTFTFDVVEDKTAPTLVSAEATTKSEIKLTFSEELSAVGTVNVGSVANNQSLVPVLVSGNVYKVTLGTALDLSAVVEVKLTYVGQADVVGNAITTALTYTFKVADDTTLPTVTGAIASNNDLTLTFSKSMDLTVGNIAVKTSAGTTNLAPAAGTASLNNTVIKFTAAAAGLNNLNPENVTVTITLMKDASIRMNLLPTTTLTLAVNDSKVPTVGANYYVTAGATAAADTVTFYFSEAMDSATLNNLSNYSGSTIGVLSSYAGTAVKSIAADGKSITLTINNANALATAGETFDVYSLKDAAGNLVVSTNVTKLASTALTLTTATLTSTTTVKAVFSTALSVVDPSSLKVVLAAGGADEAVFISAVLDSTDTTNKTVIFTTNKALSTDAALYNVKENNVSALKNIYNVALTAPGATALVDKVAPTVTMGNLADTDTDIVLTFSENMKVDGALISGETFTNTTANGYDVTTQFTVLVNGVAKAATFAQADDKTVTISIAAVETGDVVSVVYYNAPVAGKNLVDSAATGNAVANVTLTKTVQ